MSNLQRISTYGGIKSKVILVALVLILVGGTVYMSTKLWSGKKQEPQNIDISDWRTYKNEKYEYEIKYPKELTCDDSDKKHVKLRTKVMLSASVDIYSNPDNLNLKKFISRLLKDELGVLLDLSNVTWKPVTISGMCGLQASFENVAGGYIGRVSWDYVQKNDKVYRIALYQNFGQREYSKLHTMLLSTFVFTK